jgi:hypothetical protein
MVKFAKRWNAVVFAVAVCTAGSAMANAESDLPPECVQGVVSFRSGGIGTDQQDAMKLAAASYPLELQFVERGQTLGLPQGLYASDVGVTIRDGRGRIVFEATSAGPFMLARLPDGDYTISANNDGRVATKRVRVEQTKHQKVVFEWNA